MKELLRLTRVVDRLNTGIGEAMSWAILLVVLLSTGNAIFRKVFSMGSNAALELQLYLFAAIFLLNGGYTLLRNEHIRIDVLFVRLSERVRLWIDILGILFFLLPMAAMTAWMTLPMLVRTYVGAERSASEGGLLLWPAWALVVAGFVLLILQALAELVKRAAQLQGIPVAPPPGAPGKDLDPLAALMQERKDGEVK
ncbi:MAG TPA: TRAP transporter small permease subunit [Quisquiliibacterium sp.]|nr:TRAP transporter small permease subunit [Quisquiliibacterium sp.]